MPLPPELSAIIDQDLEAIGRELRGLEPRVELVLAGSLAFDEPWARRDPHGGWRIQSDYDLYLLTPSLRSALALVSDPKLTSLTQRLGTRAPVDPYVVWRPLLERGLVGMVGRSLEEGAFVQCRLDPHSLRVNQARKALLRRYLLAPREEPERRRYQLVKAAIEALRALILGLDPEVAPRALFSLRANQRWLRANPGVIPDQDRAQLDELLAARLDLEGTGPSEGLLHRVEAWLDRFAREQAAGTARVGPRARGLPSTTTMRAWTNWLRHGLLPDPRVDYEVALMAILTDPLTARLAREPTLGDAFEQRWRHLRLAPWRPPAPDALARAVDGALGNPMSAKGERYLVPSGRP